MVRLFLDFFVVRFFAAFFAVFFFAGVFVGAGGGVDSGSMGEGLNSPGMLPVGSLGLIPNMPTIGLVPSVLDILASESSSRRSNIAQQIKNCQQKIYMWRVKLVLTTTH